MYGKVLSVKTEMNFLLPYRKEARFLSHDEKRATTFDDYLNPNWHPIQHVDKNLLPFAPITVYENISNKY